MLGLWSLSGHPPSTVFRWPAHNTSGRQHLVSQVCPLQSLHLALSRWRREKRERDGDGPWLQCTSPDTRGIYSPAPLSPCSARKRWEGGREDPDGDKRREKRRGEWPVVTVPHPGDCGKFFDVLMVCPLMPFLQDPCCGTGGELELFPQIDPHSPLSAGWEESCCLSLAERIDVLTGPCKQDGMSRWSGRSAVSLLSAWFCQFSQHEIVSPPVAALGQCCLAVWQDMLEACIGGIAKGTGLFGTEPLVKVSETR